MKTHLTSYWSNLWKCENFLKLQRMAMEFCDKIDCLRAMCLCCVLVFLLPSPFIARFDLSRLYNFSRLSRIFIENENKWVFFISRDWSGRDKCAIPSIFGAITRVRSDSNRSFMRDCWWRDWDSSAELCRHKRGQGRGRARILDDSAEWDCTVASFWTSVDGCDIFPT
jgi:hypothetical protein